jgi:hypothetical protein
MKKKEKDKNNKEVSKSHGRQKFYLQTFFTTFSFSQVFFSFFSFLYSSFLKKRPGKLAERTIKLYKTRLNRSKFRDQIITARK